VWLAACGGWRAGGQAPSPAGEVRGALAGGAERGTGDFAGTWPGRPAGAVAEFAVHRSVYQLKEADPHSFGPAAGWTVRRPGRIQPMEYGAAGRERMHAELFRATMRCLSRRPAVRALVRGTGGDSGGSVT